MTTLSSNDHTQQPTLRRGSSVLNALQDIVTAGGVNSIQNFASSYSRSASFIQADLDLNAERPIHGLDIDSAGEQRRLIDAIVENQPYTTTPTEDDAVSIRSEVVNELGSSTAPQTIFNGINTLIGIGILSLPLGLHYAGWICGSLILFFSALATGHTAKLLAKCMDKDRELKTYGDIAHYSFGPLAYAVTVAIFSIDLMGATTSMIIIFADSFNALTGIEKLWFKMIISAVYFLSSFLDLRILSHFSLIGIICTSLIVATVVFAGLTKASAPGSLLDISPTNLWPKDVLSLLLSIGIFMAPFGGHAIFPELYRDMKHPYKYDKSCATIFTFTWSIDYITAVLGYLMFGVLISDQVTKSIMLQEGFPSSVKILLCTLMGVLPVSKGPLHLKPIITLIDQLTLKNAIKRSRSYHSLIKFVNRLSAVSFFFVISLLFSNFGNLMSFLGSAVCFSICLILPLIFYTKLFYSHLSPLIRLAYISGIILSTSLAVVGTVAVAFT